MISRIFDNIWKLIKENKFQTINQINNDLICTICNKLTIKTCHSSCGCIYCSDCIENYLNGKDKFCPGKSKYCQKKLISYEKDIVIDYPRNIRISEIKVKCPNKCCEFTDELSSIENHMRTCNKNPKCQYFDVKCKNNQVKNGEMKDQLCTEIFCHNKLIDFINNLRNEMESIKNAIVKLKLENEYLTDELELIKIKSINNQMKNENLEKKIVENLSEIKELNEKMIAVEKENKLLINKLENFRKSKLRKSEQQEILEINEINEKRQQKPMKQIEMKKIINKVIDNDNNIDLVVKKSNNDDEKDNKSNLPMKIMEIEKCKEKNNSGKFKWKIEDFSLKEKIDIYSEPFYSHKNGYKMCLSVWLDGDFVQVWFYLMKGEFDEDLLWPFKHGITIDIINQKNGLVHTSKTINCDDHPNDQRWNKPITERNFAIYFYSAKKSKEIIQNNRLVIKCKINI